MKAGENLDVTGKKTNTQESEVNRTILRCESCLYIALVFYGK